MNAHEHGQRMSWTKTDGQASGVLCYVPIYISFVCSIFYISSERY